MAKPAHKAGSTGLKGTSVEPEKTVAVSNPEGKTRLTGSINAFGSACVSSGVVPLSTQLPTSIEAVKPGSPAYYAGVAVGDKILSASIETNHLNLKIERNNQIFQVRLRARTDQSVDSLKPQTKAVSFNLWEKLKDYNLAFVIDHSGSMCMPLGNTSETRWHWIKEQISEFCSRAEAKSGLSFDLCLFAEDFAIEKSLSAKLVKQQLGDAVTTGTTALAPALKATLAYEFDSPAAKPLLLFVVTDGKAVSGTEVLSVVSQYGKKFGNGKKIKIVFIQTGYGEEGAQFVANLSLACKQAGMPDFVHTVFYEEISQNGIDPVLEPMLK